MKKLLSIAVLVFLVTAAIARAITVETLNAFLLFSPANHERTTMQRDVTTPELYGQKLTNLSTLLAKNSPDFVGLQEVGSAIEVRDLSAKMAESGGEWRTCFVQGNDNFTGEDVGAMVRLGPGRRVVSVSRAGDLEALSKHLVVVCEFGSERWTFLVVHLIRPIGEAQAKHARQLAAIGAWVARQPFGSRIAVLGDFNDPGKRLLSLGSVNEFLDWPATHLAGKGFDQIYTNRTVHGGDVLRSPYGRHPNEALTAAWTDHFLLWGRLE